jgi:hypothetical protein
MNEGSGEHVHDLSGNDNSGAFAGDPQWATCGHGHCVDLDGTGDVIAVSSPTALDDLQANGFSVSV